MYLQERAESPAESSTDSSSVCGNDNDENGNEGDIETNQVIFFLKFKLF